MEPASSNPPLRPTPAGTLRILFALLFAPAVVIASLRLGFDPLAREGARPLRHREGGFVGSAACRACHEDHHRTWSRTFHRTMTQEATPDTIVGSFDGRRVSYEGKSARPFVREGRFFIEIPRAEGGSREAEVVLAVGSRRYQQYFERQGRGDGFVFERLPILWHVEDRRWLHMNTIFLAPDDPDWDTHRSRWNDNCIFCHNTGARPGAEQYFPAPELAPFDSKVADLGIACEACHGPGELHVNRYRDPLARLRDYRDDGNDAGIVDPLELDPARAIAICGQCHGQRLPHPLARILEWMKSGPTYRSGDSLTEHVQPITRETEVPGAEPGSTYRLRFWADGTPRLTAYEYQGVTLSPCHERGELTCGSCHTMHGGDPRGMIEPAMRGNDACLQCHGELGRDLRAHTHHEPDGGGSACLECHMPRIVYGILGVHRSHRIESPDPARDGESGRPHACTLCHPDRSLEWSADRMSEMWGKLYAKPRQRGDGTPVELPDALASLFAGDPIQRAVYAVAMGRSDTALRPEQKGFLRGALSLTLGDGYPSIRALARRSLLRLEEELPIGQQQLLAAWDHTDRESRGVIVEAMLRVLQKNTGGQLDPPSPGLLFGPGFRPDLTTIRRLCDLQYGQVIAIGE